MSTPPAKPKQINFDPTPEIFATDSSGNFWLPLQVDGQSHVPTATYDETRLLMSLWYPSNRRTIDLDRAYVEVRGWFDTEEEHWYKLAEIEPVVPPYEPGNSFDGWLVLPVFATRSAFALAGGGFHPRARIQISSTAYLVA
ncbi:MAG: hypothetical protein WBP36_18245 [Thermoanaerobaculia bacterium]